MVQAIEPHSQTWRHVQEWAEAELDEAVRTLTQRGVGPVETEYERGRIAALSKLLSLAAEPQTISVEAVHYDDFDDKD